jgi:hypothetical protein
MNTLSILTFLKALHHLDSVDAIQWIPLAALGVAALAIWRAILVVQREKPKR